MKGWETARFDEIEELPGPGTLRWTPVRRHFGIRAFGVNAYTAREAGQDVVEEHTERSNGHEELYVVIAGRARFTLDGEEIDAGAGTLVFLRDPTIRRAAVALEAPTTVLALGGKPGEAYTVSGWEFWFEATAKGEAGDHEAAIAAIDAGFEHHPEHPMLFYQRACWEALAGRSDAALADLNRAVELGGDTFREYASDDEDLDSIRADPRFPA
ncbi:MAG: TPR end-of-group domain-containing protein [Gaiellaceae bacterium]